MKSVSVLVTIVNYRTADLTIEAVASLAPEVVERGDTYVVVVDNGSADGSAEKIAAAIVERGYGDWCSLYASAVNGGFAAGNNDGLRHYRHLFGQGGNDAPIPEFVWLLNPDTLVKPDAIGGLVRFLRAHPEAGIAGSRCFWPDGRPRVSTFRFHSARRDLVTAVGFGPLTRALGGPVSLEAGDTPVRGDWVTGSAMMVRREVIERVGLMDEGYFLYFEETDYCARVARAGFECWTIPDSNIIHIAGQSTGVTGAAARRNRRPLYWFESRARFLIRWRGRAHAHLANLAWILGYPVGKLIARLTGRTRSEPPHFWTDFLRAYYGPGGIMYRARRITNEPLTAGRTKA